MKISNGHIFEKFCRIRTNLLIRRHQGIIRIHLCSLFVVVSCSDLGNVTDFIFIVRLTLTSISDQADLGMYLIAFKSI